MLMPRQLEVSLADKVHALQMSEAYPHPIANLQAIETHFAWVFLAGEFAYKLKKPVRYDRMNHSTVAARRHNCEEELWLNRRLAPEVYLAVVPLLADSNNRLQLDGSGEVVDWLVKMRRLDSELFLDRTLRNSPVDASVVHEVGELLVSFYRRQPAAPTSAAAYLKRLASQMEDNRRELSASDLGLSRDLIEGLAARQALFLEGSAALLGRRAEEGRIIEAHGDLRPEHIYLGKPVCVIDCLEFDRDLRLLDPLEELAFLLVECEFGGAEWIGREVINQYRKQCSDAAPESLLSFYASHRAATRAKIVTWHLRDTEFRERSDWRAKARCYLQLACGHLDGHRPRDALQRSPRSGPSRSPKSPSEDS